MVRARFQRYVDRGPVSGRTRLGESYDFCMRPSPGLRDAASHDHAIFHDKRRDARVWRRVAEPASSQSQRGLHPPAIRIGCGAHRGVRRGFGGTSPAASGSDSSSPTIALKSRASRKFL